MRILLIGSGDLAMQIAHYIDNYDIVSCVIGFVDDFVEEGISKFNMKCLGKIKDIQNLYINNIFDKVIICIGYNHLRIRKEVYDSYKNIIPFYTFIHPSAIIDKSAVVGVGCCIGPLTIVEQGVFISDNNFIYGGCNISHDTLIKSHCFIAPSVTMAGFVEINECCFIGIHSTIAEKITISEDSIVGARSLILKNINEPGIYMGSPAKKTNF